MAYTFLVLMEDEADRETLALIIAEGLAADAEENGDEIAFHLEESYVYINPVREDDDDYRANKKRRYQAGISVLNRAFAVRIIDLVPDEMGCRFWLEDRPHSYSRRAALDHLTGRLFQN